MSDRLLKESDVLREVESLLISDETRHLNDLEYGNNQALYRVVDRIDDLPSTDRPQGKWIKAKPKGVISYGKAYAECDQCHEAVFIGWSMNFCPNCGADMRGGKDD